MRRIRWAATLLFACLFQLSNTCNADVRLPAIFGDHMVLQQGQKDRIWGSADPNEEVTVTIAGQTQKTKAGSDGKWTIMLEPMPVGGPHTLTVQGKNSVKFEDVLVGEVWVCSGQSNMQWSVNVSDDSDIERLAANFPNIRLISVPQVGSQEPRDTFNGKWERCSPQTVGNFSAVGYFFGRQLHQTLNVPIGLINNAWGGSACEAWIRRDLLAKDEQYKPLMDRWQQIEANYPTAKAEFQKKLEEWKQATEKAKAAGAQAPQRPQDPDQLMNGNARPANIYNGVLKSHLGYGIRGAIWYQGESNAGRAYQYRELFPLMIKSWRDEWGQGDFSFYWVQLADFLAEKSEPSDSSWAELREAQTMTMKKLPNTGQAVIIDIGEGRDIHPRNKQDVAKRLARWALAKDYGVKVLHQSPSFTSMEKQDNKVILTFDNVGSGLYAFDVSEPRGFTIAGDDRKFAWAQAKIIAPNKVEVWSDSVSHPEAVRYAWADNPVCNLYSRDGLPVTPFRTDEWPGVTANAR
jgi:sialate O-acetylesterase